MERIDLKCDVLIVGGGVGGLSCAAAVKERLPQADVLVIEKQTAGYAGKANRGGGVLQYFDPNMILMGPPGSQSIRAAQEIGLPVAREVYADRAYMPDGSLMPKTMEEAIIRDEQEVIARVIRMVKKHKVTACDGTELRMIPDTVCVHCGDDRDLALVAQIRSALEEEGVKIKPLASIVKKA